MNKDDLGEAYNVLHSFLQDRRRPKLVRSAWSVIQSQLAPQVADAMQQLLVRVARMEEVLESVANSVIAENRRRADVRRRKASCGTDCGPAGLASAGLGGVPENQSQHVARPDADTGGNVPQGR